MVGTKDADEPIPLARSRDDVEHDHHWDHDGDRDHDRWHEDNVAQKIVPI
jgi:hypothetical protein